MLITCAVQQQIMEFGGSKTLFPKPSGVRENRMSMQGCGGGVSVKMRVWWRVKGGVGSEWGEGG